MMQEIYIARHGETIENYLGVFNTQQHGTLTKEGELQAVRLGFALKDIDFFHCFSSPLKRASDTAELVQLVSYHLFEIKILDELKERGNNLLQGLHKKELGIEEWMLDDLYCKDENGFIKGQEPLAKVYDDVKTIGNIIKKLEGNILIIGHMWKNSYLVNHLLGEPWRLHHQDNCHYHYLVMNQGVILDFKENLG